MQCKTPNCVRTGGTSRRGMCAHCYNVSLGPCRIEGCKRGRFSSKIDLCNTHRGHATQTATLPPAVVKVEDLSPCVMQVQGLVWMLPTILSRLKQADSSLRFTPQQIEDLRWACSQIKSRSWTIIQACKLIQEAQKDPSHDLLEENHG